MEMTPEEKVREYYQQIDRKRQLAHTPDTAFICEERMGDIRFVLKTFGYKIPGVNAE